MDYEEQAQHTPGPWYVTSSKRQVGARIVDWAIAEVAMPADADLIAAAPELLEALILCLDFQDSHKAMIANENKARAAIAKATGVQSS